MGARRSTYERLAPPNSFIYADDFESPAELAKYLQSLMLDDELYNSYFAWKPYYTTGMNSHWLCTLCKAVSTHDYLVSWYTDLGKWWLNNETCVVASNDNPYASWNKKDSSHLYTTYM